MGQERTGFSRVLLLTVEDHQTRILVADTVDGNGFSGWKKRDNFELLIVGKGTLHLLDAKLKALDKLFGRERLVIGTRFDRRDVAVRNESQDTHADT